MQIGSIWDGLAPSRAGPARRATADEARAATGFAIGGTPPLGHARNLRVFLDRDLLAFEEVWAAAGAPDAVFRADPRALAAAARAEVADFRKEETDA